jgi:hypothetical protein
MTEEEAIALRIKAIRHATFRDAYSGRYIGVHVESTLSRRVGISLRRHGRNGLRKDGSLCDAKFMDANGWTAVHLCGRCESVETVQILARQAANRWSKQPTSTVAEELQPLGANQVVLEMG